MARPIDHLVLAARDLDALAATYRRLGFLVGGRNRHPWKTENRIVQMRGSFLELIGLAADFETVAPDDPAAPFANSVERFIAEREGLAMVALCSSNAEEDARRFAASGIGLGTPLHFSRTAEGPGGTRREVSFSTAFALSPADERPHLFVCQHHRPENFWNPAMQAHPNGARSLIGVVVTAQAPEERLAVTNRVDGEEAPADAAARRAGLGPRRDMIDFVTPQGFHAMFGAGADPWPVAIRIGVDSVEAVRQFLNVMGSPYALRDARLVVPPTVGRGVTLSFEHSP